MGQDFRVTDDGDISDGHHTFKELYRYRLLYNAALFNEWARLGLYDVHKSRLHHDGTLPFGDDKWFIVVAELPTGQISNHYKVTDWHLFDIPVRELPNVYDGYTPADVAKRLEELLLDSTLGVLMASKRKLERLQDHLVTVHKNEAATAHDRSVAERYHWQEHNGPGGIRNHSHLAGLDPISLDDYPDA